MPLIWILVCLIDELDRWIRYEQSLRKMSYLETNAYPNITKKKSLQQKSIIINYSHFW